MPLIVAVALSACSEPLEFADWTVPVADGLRVIEYPATPEAARSERIGLVEDLVLGRDANDPNQAFYRARDVDADADGNLWVLDAGNSRIQVFDATGAFVRSVGRGGQGPGELESPAYLSVMGDRVLVRSAQYRFSLFDLEGAHVTDFMVRGVSNTLSYLYARPDDTFVSSHTQVDRSAMVPGTSGSIASVVTISELSLDGTEKAEYVELDSQTIFMSSNAPKQPASVAWAFPSFGVSEAGDVYATAGSEYQILAIDPDAEPKWALRVAYVPQGLSDEIMDRALESARRRRPEATRNDLIWPERLPAIDHIAVDGHGHIYVYPHIERGEEPEDRPVDVYSPDGELLFAGTIMDRLWRRAQSDFVYAAGSDPVSGETLVWRWRLEEPF